MGFFFFSLFLGNLRGLIDADYKQEHRDNIQLPLQPYPQATKKQPRKVWGSFFFLFWDLDGCAGNDRMYTNLRYRYCGVKKVMNWQIEMQLERERDVNISEI